MTASGSPLLIALNRDARIATGPAGETTVELRRLEIACSGSAAAPVLERLANGGLPAADLFRFYCEDHGGDLLDCLALQHRLGEAGCLDYCLRIGGEEFARLTWLTGGEIFDQRRLDPSAAYRLSRFAYLRRLGERFILETPLGRARVELSPAAAAALFRLAQGMSAADLAAQMLLPDAATAQVFLALLANARALVAASGEQAEVEEKAPVGWWEFHDLLFHSRSRLGRHSNPYGGTFHRRSSDAPPSLLGAPTSHPRIALERPDLDRLKRTDPPFCAVAEARRSIRDYGPQAVTAAQLGEFLFRAARIQTLIPTGPDDLDYSFRPHPGGGAIHELVLYPVVGQAEGLARGLYRYDPLDHCLEALPCPAENIDRLLELAWITADRKSRPQIYFVLTARIGRLQWKYQSIAYAIVLKNVGALYQTMYLTATAMGLAPCALGGGDSEFFAQAAGLDGYGEAAVGEFMLGTRERALHA
ncbi:MAG: SagB/ThcOx family dehydrogenase [Alphaproteobacteria bacterium]|nr:MAG: SagB/ThcOx family dehydrogenase [Alphaproteobacteria bacterium]